MARGYFDELRALLPHAQAAKFDKNTVLLHTVRISRARVRYSRAEGDARIHYAGGSHSPAPCRSAKPIPGQPGGDEQ